MADLSRSGSSVASQLGSTFQMHCTGKNDIINYKITIKIRNINQRITLSESRYSAIRSSRKKGEKYFEFLILTF